MESCESQESKKGSQTFTHYISSHLLDFPSRQVSFYSFHQQRFLSIASLTLICYISFPFLVFPFQVWFHFKSLLSLSFLSLATSAFAYYISFRLLDIFDLEGVFLQNLFRRELCLTYSQSCRVQLHLLFAFICQLWFNLLQVSFCLLGQLLLVVVFTCQLAFRFFLQLWFHYVRFSLTRCDFTHWTSFQLLEYSSLTRSDLICEVCFCFRLLYQLLLARFLSQVCFYLLDMVSFSKSASALTRVPLACILSYTCQFFFFLCDFPSQVTLHQVCFCLLGFFPTTCQFFMLGCSDLRSGISLGMIPIRVRFTQKQILTMYRKTLGGWFSILTN